MTADKMAKNLLIDKTCNCYDKYGVVGFKYTTIDRHMGFTDYDDNKFSPKFCPWCGIPKGKTHEKI
jgi:hypothetical protein